MKVAKSMFLGGIAVDADQIESYEDYKTLGLKCPYCNEALFWRAGTEYRWKDKAEVKRGACFAHYEGETECELKNFAVRKVCVQNLPIFKESKKQRLRIYNDHLWEIISGAIELRPKVVKEVVKVLGRDRLEVFINRLVNTWVKEIDKTSTAIATLERIYTEEEMRLGDLTLEGRLRVLMDKTYFQSEGFNKYIHRAIVIEVIYYLASLTGRHVLKKLIKQIIVAEVVVLHKEQGSNELMGDNVIKVVLMALYTTPWVVEVEKRMKKA